MKTFQTLAYTLFFRSSSAVALAGDKTVGESVDDTWIHTQVDAALIGHENSQHQC